MVDESALLNWIEAVETASVSFRAYDHLVDYVQLDQEGMTTLIVRMREQKGARQETDSLTS